MKKVLVETPFPIYAISLLGEHHFVIAGGGGQAKTGVPNLIEVYYFDLVSDNPCELKATKVHVQDTQLLAPMNMDVHCWNKTEARANKNSTAKLDHKNSASNKHSAESLDRGANSSVAGAIIANFLVATGQDRFCKIYEFEYDIACLLNGQIVPYISMLTKTSRSNSRDDSTQDQRPSAEQNGALPTNGYIKRLGFQVNAERSIQTDSHPKNPFQKVVRFTPDSSKVITGGADGHFRVWDAKTSKKLADHCAHKDDVDDITVSPDGKRFITIGRDKFAYVWNIDGKKFANIPNPPPDVPEKYLFRGAKFSKLGRNGFLFYTTSIPVIKQARGFLCYLTQWIMLKNEVQAIKTISVGSEVISAMALSDCGRFLSLGSMSGSVSIYDALEFKPLLKRKEIHTIFVTGLVFLPSIPSLESNLAAYMQTKHAAVLSIAADNTVQLHDLAIHKPRKFTATMILLSLTLLIVSIFLAFVEF